jgi:hypothetical protein
MGWVCGPIDLESQIVSRTKLRVVYEADEDGDRPRPKK